MLQYYINDCFQYNLNHFLFFLKEILPDLIENTNLEELIRKRIRVNIMFLTSEDVVRKIISSLQIINNPQKVLFRILEKVLL